MNLVYVPFTFGTIIPLLFPLGLFGLWVMYFTERLMVYYSYTRPPQLDSTITKNAIKQMYAAPVIILWSSAWVFSNQQVFMNKVPKLDPQRVFPESQH
jgi:hypothetical protein